MTVQWQSQLELGVTAIDAQHRVLIERANLLEEAVRQRRGASEVTRLIFFLGQYVATHFAAEEKLMREAGYPQYAIHRQLHADFLLDYMLLRQQYEQGGASEQLLEMLRRRVTDWVVSHIQLQDRQIADFLEQRR